MAAKDRRLTFADRIVLRAAAKALAAEAEIIHRSYVGRDDQIEDPVIREQHRLYLALVKNLNTIATKARRA